MALRVFEGKDRIADLSKSWQQFVLGVVLFYFVHGFLLGQTALSLSLQALVQGGFSTALVLNSSFVFMLAYCFASVFFVVLFIKRYNAASSTDLGFVFCLIGGALLLASFASLFELPSIIQGALGEGASASSANSLQSLLETVSKYQPASQQTLVGSGLTGLMPVQSKPNVLKTLFSIVFYFIAGLFLARRGNQLNKGTTPVIGMLAILLLPLLTLSIFLTLSSVFEGFIAAVFKIGFGSTPLSAIISNIVLLTVLSMAGIKLLLHFLNHEERENALSFQILALKISGGTFVLLFLLALTGFSSIMLIEFGKTELPETLAIIAGIVFRAGFYGFMVFAMFYLSDFIQKIAKGGMKIQFQQASRPFPKSQDREIMENGVLERLEKTGGKSGLTPKEENGEKIEYLATSLASCKFNYSRDELVRALKDEGYSDEIAEKVVERLGM